MSEAQEVVRFKGHKTTLGDRTFIIPALNLKSIQQLKDKIKSFEKITNPVDQINDVADLALAAIKRNYPDVTRDELMELIDMDNMSDLILIVMGQSGLIKKDKDPLTGEVQGGVTN